MTMQLIASLLTLFRIAGDTYSKVLGEVAQIRERGQIGGKLQIAAVWSKHQAYETRLHLQIAEGVGKTFC
jgi:hypothetical protein